MYSGFARVSHLRDEPIRETFHRLSRYQERFLQTDASWRPRIQWPRYALNWWSRRWEYPYTYNSLRRRPESRVLDAGSGITFFPFLLAQEGIEVTCVDRDRFLGRAFQASGARLDAPVDFAMGDLLRLPFQDDSFDEAYCISVLEHLTARKKAVSELARVLGETGRLVLTFDVGLGDVGGVPISTFRSGLLLDIKRHFRIRGEIALDQDRDLLTTLRMGRIEGEEALGHGPTRRHFPGPRSVLTRLANGRMDPLTTFNSGITGLVNVLRSTEHHLGVIGLVLEPKSI